VVHVERSRKQDMELSSMPVEQADGAFRRARPDALAGHDELRMNGRLRPTSLVHEGPYVPAVRAGPEPLLAAVEAPTSSNHDFWPLRFGAEDER
jgi:hypothetical protein